jgi:hypothetical protein
LGTDACHKKLLFQCINAVKNDPDHRWFDLGDDHECIAPGDKRFSYERLPKEQKSRELYDLLNGVAQTVSEILAPIGPQCLGRVRGNHEDTIITRLMFDVHARICEKLNPGLDKFDLMTSGRIRLRFWEDKVGGKLLDEKGVWYHHGFGGGRKSGAKVNRVDEAIRDFPGNDIYVTGHGHSRFVLPAATIHVGKHKDELIQRICWTAMNGTFLRTYHEDETGYGERYKFQPSSLGCVTFTFTPRANGKGLQIDGHMTEDGLPFLR